MPQKAYSTYKRKKDMREFLVWAILLALGIGGYWKFTQAEAYPATADMPAPRMAARPAVTDQPIQTNLPAPRRFMLRGYTLSATHSYIITARILRRENYFSDRESDLSPTDLALGWGRMSDPNVLSTIDISQRGRFYYWKTPQYPIPRTEIEHNSANHHIIPANESVAEQLRSLKKNQIVTLTGYLVNAAHEDGWHWYSSTTRMDTGKGACELFYVTGITVH